MLVAKIFQRNNTSLKEISLDSLISLVNSKLNNTNGIHNNTLTIKYSGNTNTDKMLVLESLGYNKDSFSNPDITTTLFQSSIEFRDSNSVIGSILGQIRKDLNMSILRVNNPNNTNQFHDFCLYYNDDGSAYGTCYINDGGNKNNISYDIVVPNTKYLVDNFVQKVINTTKIFVGGENASDTEDLHKGRGFSTDKPFKTLCNALKYIVAHLALGNDYVIEVILQEDVELPAFNLISPNIYRIKIRSDTVTTRKITFTGTFGLFNTSLYLEYLNLDNFIMSVDGFDKSAIVKISNVNITGDSIFFNAIGNCAQYYLSNNIKIVGTANSNYGLFNIKLGALMYSTVGFSTDSAVTGKRFTLSHNGRICVSGRGLECIPGSIAGTMDSTSIYT